MVSPSPANNTFVGRQQEMADLKAMLRDTLDSRGRVVLLSGEPGIGKTRTAQELASNASTLGFKILWGWCYEQEGAPPYWPWQQTLGAYVQESEAESMRSQMGPGAADIDEIVSQVGDKLPDLAPAPALEPEQARFRLFVSIANFLRNACLVQPLVLVLDDLHWADRSSLLLLEFLAREIAASRLLLIGCYRDVELTGQHPLSQTLGSLIREPNYRRVQLSGLSLPEVSDYIEVNGRPSVADDAAEIVHRRTNGNPLFVGEIVRLLGPEQFGADHEWATVIPEGIRDAIRRRLTRMSADCNRVLQIGSVIGRQFDYRLLRPLADGLDEHGLLEALEEALAARMLEEVPQTDGWHQFTHALVQDTLAEEFSSTRRARLHARIAEKMEALYGDDAGGHAAELAYHFASAQTVLGTEKCAMYSLLAGEQALDAYAYEEAIQHFRRALAAKKLPEAGTEPAPDAQAAALLLGLGRAQAATVAQHQLQAPLANLTRAFEYYVQAGDLDRAVAIVESSPRPGIGRPVGMTGLVSHALQLVPPHSHLAGRLLAFNIRVMGLEEGDYAGAQEAFRQAMAIARREGDTGLEMRVLGSSADVALFHTHFQECIEKGSRAVELARECNNLQAEVAALYVVGLAIDTSISDTAEEHFYASAMLSVAESLRDRAWVAGALWNYARFYSAKGDWDNARLFSDRGLALLPQDTRLLYVRTQVEYAVGALGEGDTYLKRLLDLMRLATPGPTVEHAFPAAAMAVAAHTTGDAERLDIAQGTAEAVLSSSSVTPVISTIAFGTLGLIAVLKSDADAAAGLYADLVPLRGIRIADHFTVDRVLGLLSVTQGKLGQAMAHFDDMLAMCRRASRRPELAWTCYDYAHAVLHPTAAAQSEGVEAGLYAMAKELLDEAAAIATELSMRPLLDRVTELREQARPPKGMASAYPDGLTQREVEVLRLVALGKANREIAEELIISIRTVGNHVHSILDKISAANRTEAANYAVRHGLALPAPNP